MNIFGGSVNWGFSSSDIWSNSMTIIGSLAAFIVLGIVIKFAPSIIWLIKNAILYRRHNLGAAYWAREFKAHTRGEFK